LRSVKYGEKNESKISVLDYARFMIRIKFDKERVTAKFACFSVVDYGHRKDAIEIVFISY